MEYEYGHLAVMQGIFVFYRKFTVLYIDKCECI